MKYYVCDRCGVKLDNQTVGTIHLMFSKGKPEAFDLCDDCLTTITVLIKNPQLINP